MKNLWLKTRLSPFAIAIACLLVIAAQEISYGEIRHVPADYATIQAAIDASVSGDTVLVSPGTYVENINYLGKNLLVKSTEGAGVTTIESAGPTAPVVSFVSGESRAAVLDGFWIFDKDVFQGVFCANSSPTIRFCTISGSHSSGIGVESAAPLVENNLIRDNLDGGISAYLSATDTLEIVHNRIEGNRWHAIAIARVSSPVLIVDNLITGNVSGITVEYLAGSVKCLRNVITNNDETGITIYSGEDIDVSNNTVQGNRNGIAIAVGVQYRAINNIIVDCLETAIIGPNRQFRNTLLWGNLSDFDRPDHDWKEYIHAAPRFVSAMTNDYSLDCSSFAIDNGETAQADSDGSSSDIGAIPFDHNDHLPMAANLGVNNEDFLHVFSPNPQFIWSPRLTQIVIQSVDTLFCVVFPDGTTFCAIDTVFTEGSATQLGYELEVGTDSYWSVAELMATGPVDGSDTLLMYTGSPLEAGGTYYVRIRLRDNAGWGCWKETIVRRNASPLTPEKLSPPDNSRLAANNVILRAKTTPDFEYDSAECVIEVYSDQALTELVHNRAFSLPEVSSTIIDTVQQLAAGSTYWWRIRATDGSEFSPWSNLTSFRVSSPSILRVPSEYATIQAAVNSSVDGDTILLAPGTYVTSVNLRSMALTIIGEGGASQTRLIEGSDAGFRGSAAAPKITRFSGLHFDQIRYAMRNNGPVEIRDCRFTRKFGLSPISELFIFASILIDNCLFEGTPDVTIGGYLRAGMTLSITNSRFLYPNSNPYTALPIITIRSETAEAIEATIQNNVFIGNNGLDAIEIDPPSFGHISNNTFYNCRSAIMLAPANEALVLNNIIMGCSATGITAYSATCDYNNLLNNSADYLNTLPGPNDISVDPLFVDTANGDFSLLCNSPCIDAGDPASAGFAGKRKDIGAFEYQYVVGNADGHLGSAVINLTDAVFLVNRIFSGGPAPCPAGAGMIDCDNSITISDVVYLVNYLYAHGPVPCVPGR